MYIVKAKALRLLNQRALVILILEVVFGSLTYIILQRPYNGELWIKAFFWTALVISSLAFALNLRLGWHLVTRKEPMEGHKTTFVLFCVSLLFIILLNFGYWLQIK